VSTARAKLVSFCHPDKACLPKNSFVTKLEGVGTLMGPQARKVCLPCYLYLIAEQVMFLPVLVHVKSPAFGEDMHACPHTAFAA